MTYRTVGADVVADAAERAVAAGAARVCLVASGRGPTDNEIEQVAEAVMAVRDAHPGARGVCLSRAAGGCTGRPTGRRRGRLPTTTTSTPPRATTARSARPTASTTASTPWNRRSTPVCRRARAPCSAWGRSDDDIVDVGFALRDLEVDSVPINFLIPVDGTPLAGSVGADPAAVPANPGPVPVPVPDDRGPDRRWARGPSALGPGTRPRGGELDLRRRLPHHGGSGRQRRSPTAR